MPTSHPFPAAPWPRSLKVSSALGTVLLIGVGIASYRAIPVASGFTHGFGLTVSLILPALLLGSLFSTVTGYTVSATQLQVRRLLWTSRFPLAGLRHAFPDPAICHGAIRLIGNAGLYGFTGLYRSKRLGRFHLFATDLRRGVVLVLPDRTLVVTPAAPEAFLAHLHRFFPASRAPMPPA